MKTEPARRMIVLFADDDTDDQEMMKSAFEAVRADIDLRIVNDGQELVDLLKQSGNEDLANKPLMILLDLNMPRKDGHEALAELKNDERLHHIPVVIFSTSNDDADINEAYKFGAASYVVKPRQWEDLLEFARNVDDYWDGRNVFASPDQQRE